MIKKAVVLGLCLASSIALADCRTRSDIKLVRQNIEFGPTDVQKMVTPGQCIVHYRVNIDDEWRTVEGIGRGPTEAAACQQALDVTRGTLLLEVSPKSVSAETQLVCTDLDQIHIRPVRIGEVIWESETDVHRHAKERKYFDYKQTKCRMFTERNVKDRNLYTYQGIICRVNSRPDSKWRVVDKY